MNSVSENILMQKQLNGKTALVTGASQGIGYAIAVTLAKHGAHVICIARNATNLEHLDDEIQRNQGTATLVPLDLTDHCAIDTLGYEIAKRWKSLDILISNAGTLGILTPINLLDPQILQDSLSLNFTANFRLIRAMHPLLLNAHQAHAIFMTSNVVGKNRPFFTTYSASKAALEEMVLTYAQETQSHNICVQLFNPGAVKTQMRRKIYPGEDQNKLTLPEEIATKVLEILTQKNPQTGTIYNHPKKF